ncbi:MAG: sensor histidine kinase, partial [Caulobacteraceae bacterium]
VGAVWLGLGAANAISAPIGRLVQAAGKVSAGDLDARVSAGDAPAEIAVLSNAFNQMTEDLQGQQTALRAARVEAESRREFIETVLSGVSAGVVGLDPDGKISALNAQATKLLGVGREVIGQPLTASAPEFDPVVAAARRSGAAEQEIDLMRGQDARRLNVRAGATAEGGLVLTFDDITRLVTAQRNAAWRDVARRIAHEIRNPLTPIQLSAERLRRKYRGQITEDVDTFDRCTDTIVRQVGDIGRMVDEFSAFARMPVPRFGKHDASELLREAVFARRVADPDITIDYDAPDSPVMLVCDDRMLGQALTNVIKNAGEAIATRRATDVSVKGHIRVRLTRSPDRVTFEVEDNGVGLPAAAERDRLTEPYVTTREKGTGLGLAIVKRILEEHGGELRLTDADKLPGAKAILAFNTAPTPNAESTPSPALETAGEPQKNVRI